ncbi:MAG: hypothetical protein H7Y18_15445 [Clostridiaceae bacterium]|nr:hypothetical protein [Clostridiaceae bacterium]
MVLTESSLNKLMLRLKEKTSFGENIRYSVPDLWNCFGYNGQEKFIDEKGITLVNPYNFYFSCINDFIMPKKNISTDYNKSVSQILCNFHEEEDYLGGDWIKKSSIYAMDVRISTAWDHNGSGLLEDCDENGFKETGTFLKTIALLPLLKKMGITTLYLLPISKFPSTTKDFSVIDSGLNDPMIAEDLTAIEEFKALVEACHILDIRIIVDIIPKNLPGDNEMICNAVLNIILDYQNNLGIDGAILNMGHEFPVELVNRIIDSSRRLDKDFCFISAKFFSGELELSSENGYNMATGYNWGVESMISQSNTYKFITGLSKFKSPAFVYTETPETPRIAAGEYGKLVSKFLTILNEFLPNSVPIITSGVEVYETKSLNTSLELNWINQSRWDIPDTLEAISKIKNQFLDTFTNPNNFFHVNFESPYTTAIGLAYIIEGNRWKSNENVIIIVGNTDLNNSREYTLFLENIRYESGNGSKRAWLLYSQNEWSHDIYDFDHQSDLQLSFKPGEIKILIM